MPSPMTTPPPSPREVELEKVLAIICGAFPTKLIMNGDVDKVCAEMRAKYAVVPREPTAAMLRAGMRGMLVTNEATLDFASQCLRDEWAAMIAAAPEPRKEGIEPI